MLLKHSNIKRLILTCALVAAASVAAGQAHYAYAQQSCALTSTEEEKAACEARLRAELAQVEKEIAEQQGILANKKKESASIERDIAILNAEIKEAQLKIRAKTISIAQLGKDIDVKTQTIGELSEKIERGKESLSQLIRKTNEIDSFTVVEVMLSNDNLSTFFEDLDAFDSIEKSLQVSFTEIKDAREENESEKETLHTKRNQETDAKVAIEAQKRIVEQKEAEKKRLLNLSKSEEAAYQSVIREREQKAATIRAALFALRDTAAIPFGDALAYANAASKATGVRPAFILGILKQESNLGQNVGQCYLKDPLTGAGVGKNTGTPFANVMKPDRDVQPFLALSKRLGFDPYTRPVSCPIAGLGYGGAMGPSQFIASTWISYESRVGIATGNPAPSPWNPKDAFFATALFLRDLGAAGGGYSAELEAAARYYAGGGWATRGMGYANSVLGHARTIQETMINPLQGL